MKDDKCDEFENKVDLLETLEVSEKYKLKDFLEDDEISEYLSHHQENVNLSQDDIEGLFS